MWQNSSKWLGHSTCFRVQAIQIQAIHLRFSFSTLRKVTTAQAVAAMPSARHTRRSSHLKSNVSPTAGATGSQAGSGTRRSTCSVRKAASHTIVYVVMHLHLESIPRLQALQLAQEADG